MENTRLLIDGELVEGDLRLDVMNPATGTAFLNVSRASAAQLDVAVAAAARAQKEWAKTSFETRAACVLRFADAIRDNAEPLARLLVQEQGKPLVQARGEIRLAEDFIRYFAEQRFEEEQIEDGERFRSILRYRPLGVIAAIVPWNFPVLIACFKIAPALMMGNSLILKPAQTTPATALMIAGLVKDIFAPGTFNVIVDDGDLGQALTVHAGIAKISFTGSTATGRRVMASAAEGIKRVTLELGGNDAAILLDDCDVDAVADRLLDGAWTNAGQICTAIKRIYAPRARYAALCDALVSRAVERRMGNGLDETTRVGPLQNRVQYEKAGSYLDVARADGDVIFGGEGANAGNFIHPTIVRNITATSRLVREEQFCPVLPVLPYDSLDDAIAEANSTEYGLGGSVWTAEPERGLDVARRIESGTLWINTHDQVSPWVPMSGAKQSGLGVEFARFGMEEYAQRTVMRVFKAGQA